MILLASYCPFKSYRSIYISVDCAWEWGEWEKCDKPSGSGKQIRKKTIKKYAEVGGNCNTAPLEERLCTQMKYTSKNGFITDKKWETIKSQEFQAEQDRKIPILFKIQSILAKLSLKNMNLF